MESAIIDNLKQARNAKQDADSDKDGLFGRQIAATLRRFTTQQKAIAKLRFQQILVDIEFGQIQDAYQFTH